MELCFIILLACFGYWLYLQRKLPIENVSWEFSEKIKCPIHKNILGINEHDNSEQFLAISLCETNVCPQNYFKDYLFIGTN